MCVCVCVCVCVCASIIIIMYNCTCAHSCTVADALKTLDQAQFGKWTAYLQLKGSIYESYVR